MKIVQCFQISTLRNERSITAPCILYNKFWKELKKRHFTLFRYLNKLLFRTFCLHSKGMQCQWHVLKMELSILINGLLRIVQNDNTCIILNTVNSAFSELGYNEISEFLNIHLFKTDFSKQRYYYRGGKDFIFPWSLEFHWLGNLLYMLQSKIGHSLKFHAVFSQSLGPKCLFLFFLNLLSLLYSFIQMLSSSLPHTEERIFQKPLMPLLVFT